MSNFVVILKIFPDFDTRYLIHYAKNTVSIIEQKFGNHQWTPGKHLNLSMSLIDTIQILRVETAILEKQGFVLAGRERTQKECFRRLNSLSNSQENILTTKLPMYLSTKINNDIGMKSRRWNPCGIWKCHQTLPTLAHKTQYSLQRSTPQLPTLTPLDQKTTTHPVYLTHHRLNSVMPPKNKNWNEKLTFKTKNF